MVSYKPNSKMHRLVCVLLLLCHCLVLSGCTQDGPETHAEMTRSCGSSRFRVAAENLGTTAEGTILVYEKEEDVLGIKAVLSAAVGAEDYGGVEFYLPVGCSLDDILYAYPEMDEPRESDLPIEVWETASDHVEFCSVIEIGRARDLNATGGGTAVLVINASYECEDEDAVRALKFAVGCGASQEDGHVIWGAEHSEILVEIERAN